MAKMKYGTNLIFAIIGYLGYTLHWYAKSIDKIGIRVHFLFLFIWAEADDKMGKGEKWMPTQDGGDFFGGWFFLGEGVSFLPALSAYIDTASFPLYLPALRCCSFSIYYQLVHSPSFGHGLFAKSHLLPLPNHNFGAAAAPVSSQQP